MYSILCVDDDRTIVSALAVILKKSGYNVFIALSGSEALEILEKETINIAIIDYKMPYMDGIELLKKIKKDNEDIEVLMLTGHGTIDNAVESIKMGAFDYLIKPFHKNDILNRIDKILKIKNLQNENIQLKSRLKDKYQFNNLIGNTPKMASIFEMISRISNSDSTVLILGDTGTGKEEIAKAIHFSGNRSEKPFNIIDCTSINPNLIESELFGHVKGAFTGAIHDKTGLLNSTEDGTLFLDEIAEIPMFMQVKLLRAIEERVIRPVGSIVSQKLNARIIAATRRNLRDAINKQEFREDLYYRLNVINIDIPPLCDRKDDIPLLVNHFISKYDGGEKLIEEISEEALKKLMEYDWPGNIRELENCIERAFTLGASGKIKLENLPETVRYRDNVSTDKTSKSSITLSDHEKTLIVNSLKKTNGNKRKTAKILNIGVTTLYRKLKKYGIEY
ncbi:sigma-54-dependent transcriptional regulator [candidate division KSB1 bacterium]